MARNQSFWDKFWEDKDGNTVIVTKPNLPIVVFVAAAIIYALFQNSAFGKFFGWVAIVALALWALLEVFRGANYFRRLLGLSVLLLTAMFTVV